MASAGAEKEVTDGVYGTRSATRNEHWKIHSVE